MINKIGPNPIIENYCKITDINPRGGINDKRVALNYPPQSDILTSSCNEYWKEHPMSDNDTLVDQQPIIINEQPLDLPKEKQFADNTYKAGLVDFNKLANIINDKNTINVFEISKELLIDPLTGKKLKYKYELVFALYQLNKKTWINRWQYYNPSVKKEFKDNEIKSPIDSINQLNKEFIRRCDILQKVLLTKKQLLLFGLLNFNMFKYKLLQIYYIESDHSKPCYVMEIALYRESDLYLNTFSYIGYFIDGNLIISDTKYIGKDSTDKVLLADFYNPKEITQEIINKNYSNAPIIDKNPDSIVALTKKQNESFKIKNQYACFNLNYDENLKGEYILPYYSREQCESSYDFYGKQKSVGIYDKPCTEDDECPFFNINKNYDNTYGKCMDDGHCQLPINMKKIGYHYYSSNNTHKPLCYNCESNKFNVSSSIDTCCDEQYNTEKYPFLKSPDYAFKDDYLDRQNSYNSHNCYNKPGTFDIECKS